MKWRVFCSLVLLSLAMISAQELSWRPVHTYSIVARDPATGEMGVAVQSHWFSVGSVVSWAEAGVGAIATQSLVNVSFGPNGLKLLREGHTAEQVLDVLLAEDEGREWRQVAIVDAEGRIATHTGARCIAEAGHVQGAQFSCQANMMLRNTVWGAMKQAFESSKGPLAERLLAALEAAEAEKGDIRGKQSCALLVVRGQSTGKVWEDRLVDLRIEDHPEPLVEMRRLLRLYRAYENMNNGDLAMEKNDIDAALKFYSAARDLCPENLEMQYWTAVSLANAGRIQAALPLFRFIFKKDNNWRMLTQRLPAAGLLHVEKDDFQKILQADK